MALNTQYLQESAAQFNLTLSDFQLAQFDTYLTLLLVWNERMNLTAVREPHLILIRHFLDALTCATVTGDLNGRSLIDVGTGAGFPGLPLKILFPHCRLTLTDSLTKKTQFLEEVVSALDLSEVTICAERAETLGQLALHRAQYDWAMARGVIEMRALSEYLLPLCQVGGHMLAQKGANAQKEVESALTAIMILGGAAPRLQTIQLPEVEVPHLLVTVKKIKETPAKYPRRPGIPAKRPLGPSQ
ncbi:MAG: 16S rRNA (guanine(527)-N(7))-methyltransferase RsmG [Chloroflexi bacterium]|nr:MAG: 16S rRNA (guanine(527)-N(7))-methyltransferase RsmG [Chloroflexota bacterium]